MLGEIVVLKPFDKMSKKSIAESVYDKWDVQIPKIVQKRKKPKTIGYKTCALCICYNMSDVDHCGDCPICDFTGISYCEGAPFEHFVDAISWINHDGLLTNEERDELLDLAKKESQFLHKILDEWVNDENRTAPVI